MPRRAPNLMEYFERASSAKKIVSVQEFAQKLNDVVERRTPLMAYRFRPLPKVTLGEVPRILCRYYSNDNTFEWVDGKKASECSHGQIFKNGIAIGYDTLIDLANGFDVDPCIMYTAFELCENHAIHLRHGRLQRKMQDLAANY